MTRSLISCIVPVFNGERYLSEALESIFHQSYQPLEVIIVDDGSTDGTAAVAAAYGEKVTYLRQDNAGPAAARNLGLNVMHGEFVAFLDADDAMLPERLAAQLELLDAEPDLGLVHTDLMTFDESGIIHTTRRAFSDPCGGMVLDRLLLDNFITTSTVMARKEYLTEVGMFNVNRRISHDFELWLRMAARWKVGYIDRPLVRYRYRPGSLSHDKLATAKDALDVLEAFWQEHPEHRRSQPALYRNSLAEQLSAAGSAALGRGRRGSAIAYLMRSLRLDPWKLSSWKSLVKALVRPSPRHDASVGGAPSE
jgi:glycosyltransferase involved in cell wall biosynthesis